MPAPTYHGTKYGETGFFTPGSDFVIPLPNNAVAGQEVCAFLNNGTADPPTPTTLSDMAAAGWGQIYASTAANWRGIFVKEITADDASASAAGTWALTLRNSANSRYSYVTTELRNLLSYDTTIAVHTGTAGLNLASPSNTVDWGVADTRFLCGYMCDAVNGITTPPAGYTLLGEFMSTNSQGSGTSVYTKAYPDGAGVAFEQPGNWTLTNQRTAIIFTMALRPLAAAAGGAIAAYYSNQLRRSDV